jgi:hypothetical protein
VTINCNIPLMNKSHLFVVVALLLLFSGCRKGFITANQEIWFQVEYVNYAWGYQHDGFLIDMSGNVLVYDNPGSWNFPDENMNLTEQEMEENLKLCSPSGLKIPEAELARYSSYIPNIAASKLTSPKQTAADAGSISFICYQINGDNIYKGNLVRQEGDWTRENLNFYSKRVVAWLKEIQAGLPTE